MTEEIRRLNANEVERADGTKEQRNMRNVMVMEAKHWNLFAKLSSWDFLYAQHFFFRSYREIEFEAEK